MTAKSEEKRVELYVMDLIWGIAKQHYDGLPMPSEIWTNKDKIDRRSGKQIIGDLLKNLGGE